MIQQFIPPTFLNKVFDVLSMYAGILGLFLIKHENEVIKE